MIRHFTHHDNLPTLERWIVHGREAVYESPWVSLDLVDVEPPGRPRYRHHVVRVPHDGVGVVVHHEEQGVLLLYRHRFATDTAGFEVPAGGIESGESVAEAGAREVLEETGWLVDEPKLFHTTNASDGMSNQRFHLTYARAQEFTGHIADRHESSALCWVPVDELTRLVVDGRVPCALTSLSLLVAQSLGFFDRAAG